MSVDQANSRWVALNQEIADLEKSALAHENAARADRLRREELKTERGQLAGTNSDTLGSLRIDCNKSTYQIPPVEGEVLPATVFDALVTNAAGGANGFLLSLASNQVDVAKVGGVTQTGGDIYATVTNIAVTSAALNSISSTATFTTGTQTNTYTSTAILDGTYHSVADVAGTTDFYYEFDVSATTGGTGTGITWDGYLSGVANTMKVYAYNWGTTTFEQIGTVAGIAGTNIMQNEWELTNSHTGTGGNLGKVRIRFANTGLTASSLKTDRILLGYAVVLTPPTNWSSMSIDGSGRMDIIKIAGTTQTAKDLGAINVTNLNTLSGHDPGATLGTSTLTQSQVTGGAYALSTDSNGRVRIVDGTGTGEIDTSSGAIAHVILCDTTTTNTDALSAAAIWQDTTASHFTTALSVGKSIMNGVSLGTGLTVAAVSGAVGSLTTNNDKTGYTLTVTPPTAAQNATAIWTDLLAGSDFSTVASIGKLLKDDIDAAISSRGTGTSLDAAGVRAAVGLGSANLDTQLAALPTATAIRNAVTGGAYALDTDANGRIRIVDGTAAGELDTSSGKVLLAATQAFDNTGTWTGNITGSLSGSVGSVTGAVGSVTGAVGSVTGAVGSVTGAVGSIASGGIAAASIATAAAEKLADITLRRTPANLEASSFGDTLALGSLYGIMQQLQKSSTLTHANKLTVFKTDGTTELGQLTITSSAAADPITSAL